jgi:hypothetical protein
MRQRQVPKAFRPVVALIVMLESREVLEHPGVLLRTVELSGGSEIIYYASR